MITFYGMSSPNVMKVSIFLEEAQLQHEFRWVDIWGGQQFSSEFVALNPNSKVPVLVDDESPYGGPVTVWESGAILLYLSQKTGLFLSKEPREQLTTMQWLMFQMSTIGPMFGQSNHFRLSAPKDNDYAVKRYVTEVKRLVDVLERRLGEVEYLAGEYSIADIATYPWARYHEQNGVDLAHLPNFNRWYRAIESRPAVDRVVKGWGKLTEQAAARRQTVKPEELDRLFGRNAYSRA